MRVTRPRGGTQYAYGGAEADAMMAAHRNRLRCRTGPRFIAIELLAAITLLALLTAILMGRRGAGTPHALPPPKSASAPSSIRDAGVSA